MRKSFLFGAVALLGLAACSNDEFLGDESVQNANGAIAFNSKAGKVSRATTDLEKYVTSFNVYGIKNPTAETNVLVFNNYQVDWANNTHGLTASNTHDWEYVGEKGPDGNKKNQTIKYWDYSVPNYLFWAAAPANKAVFAVATDAVKEAVTNRVMVKKGEVSTATFENVETSDDPASVIFYADPLKVDQANYGKAVTPIFKRLQAKVRFGFYETIPGYAVSDVQFYERASTGTEPTKGANQITTFSAMSAGEISTKAKYVITYDNDKLTSTLAATPSTDAGTKVYNLKFGGLDYKSNIATSSTNSHINAGTSGKLPTLEVASSAPTYAKNASYPADASTAKVGQDQYYIAVLPTDAANAKAIKVMCDFVLTSEDTKEQIKVTGATATIPADYTIWNSNYSYTYLFKISDQVNGTTGTVTGGNNDKVYPTDPWGKEHGNGTTPTTGYGVDPNGKKPSEDGWGIDTETGKPYPELDKDGDGKIDDKWKNFKDESENGVAVDDGLYAITFDAVVASNDEAYLNGTISTVSEPSVTTYQEGSVNAGGIVYHNAAKKPIEIEVVENKAVVTPVITGTGVTLQVHKVTVDGTTGAVAVGEAVDLTVKDNKAKFTPTQQDAAQTYRVTYGANLEKVDNTKVIKVVKFIEVVK